MHASGHAGLVVPMPEVCLQSCICSSSGSCSSLTSSFPPSSSGGIDVGNERCFQSSICEKLITLVQQEKDITHLLGDALQAVTDALHSITTQDQS